MTLDVAPDPRGLALVAGGVLISDRANHRLMLVSGDDFTVSRFGNAALQGALAEIATQQAYSIAQLEGDRYWSIVTPVLSLTLITSVLVIGSFLAMRRIRLGSDGSRLYLIDLFGRSAAAPPSVLISGQQLTANG